MKKNFSLSFLLSAFLMTNGQLKQIAQGPEFPEPEEGIAKILNMKNGNTVYVHISVSDGIYVRIYDANHIEKAVTNTIPSYGKLKWKGFSYYGTRTEYVYGIFEVNNDVVIFLGTDNASVKKTVYKLLIDGTSGRLKEDTIIAKPEGDFIVTKDQVNDHYAVFISGKLEPEGKLVSSISVMGSDHKEIRKISIDDYPGIDQEHKNWISNLLLVNDNVYALFFSAKITKKTGEYSGNVLMAISQSGTTSFSKDYIPLKSLTDMRVWGNGIKYNPITKKIYFFTMKNNNLENYKRDYKYLMYLNIIDLELKRVQSFENARTDETINDAYKKRFSKKDDYLGVPQNLYINDDGSFSLIWQERMEGGADGDNVWIGKVLQSNYDKDGKFKSGYIVPKFHNLFRVKDFPFARLEWEITAQTLDFGSQYKHFIYLDGTENKYLLYNDVEKNGKVTGDKYGAVAGLGGCDTYIYKLTGNELVPERKFAFGEPDKEHNVAMLAVSDYDKKTNMLVTLMLNAESKKNKTVKVVWLQPQ